MPQLYHHEIPGTVAVGANAALGATSDAKPRLQPTVAPTLPLAAPVALDADPLDACPLDPEAMDDPLADCPVEAAVEPLAT
jgi:hypothetical protein